MFVCVLTHTGLTGLCVAGSTQDGTQSRCCNLLESPRTEVSMLGSGYSLLDTLALDRISYKLNHYLWWHSMFRGSVQIRKDFSG